MGGIRPPIGWRELFTMITYIHLPDFIPLWMIDRVPRFFLRLSRWLLRKTNNFVLFRFMHGWWSCYFVLMRILRVGLPQTRWGEHEARSIDYRSDDVIVAVPGKSGTTLLTQICDQLRRGAPGCDCEDLNDLVPWIENGGRYLQQDVNSNRDEQRVYKSHLPYRMLPRNVKLIYCYRSCDDAFYSMYKFLIPMLDLDEEQSTLYEWSLAFRYVVPFAKEKLMDLLDWWQHRNDDNVLFFLFEDLIRDREGAIRKIADFMNIPLSEELLERTLEYSAHQYMSQHPTVFDDHKVAARWAHFLGSEHTRALTGKVRKGGGKQGQGAAIPTHLREHFDQSWRTIITPQLGFESYNDMLTSREVG